LRKLLLGLAVLVVLLIAAVLVLPGFLDWNQYKGQLTGAAREATGRSVVIDGDISLRLLPAPALSAAGVRIGNIAGGSTADMVRLTALDVRVALVPLLSGRIEVSSVRLVEPVAVFEVLADGRANWDLGDAPPAPGGAAATGTPAPATAATAGDATAGDAPLRLTLDRFEIVAGEVIYRDARSGIEERVTGLNISGSADSLQGPFAVAGELRARELPLRLDLSLGRIAAGRAVPLRLTAGLADELELDLKGRVEGLPTAARISGVLRVESADLARVAARGGVELPSLLALPVKLDTRIAASAEELAFNDIVLDLGGANASGALNLGLADGLTFDAALAVGRLDLDAMLAARAEAEETSTVAPDTAGAGDAGDASDADAGAVVVPSNVAGNLTLNVDGIAYQGSVIRQAQLALTMLDGRLELTRAAALLPGGSDVSLTGQAVNADGGARFDGRLAFASDSLRSLLTWLGIDVTAVPAARLTSFSVTTNVVATPSLIQLSDANLRLDTIAGTAAAAYRLQRRPSFGVSLSVDRVNLDAYMPPVGDGVPARADAAAGGQAGQTQPATGDAVGLALLDRFDANLLLNIARLSARGADLNGVAVNASLVGGMLEMKKLQVADLAGGTLLLTGSARSFAAEPEVDASLQYQAATVAGLTRLIGFDTGAAVERLSDLALTTTVRGTASALALRAQLSLAGGQGSINGTLADPKSAPKLALDFQLEHPSLAELFAAMALEQAPSDADDMPVKLTGAVEGEAGDLQATMELGIAAARLSASGRLDPFREAPQLDLVVRLAGDDINRSLAALGTTYRPAVKVPGGYALDVRLAGDTRELALDGFAARFGPIELDGSGTARFDGARPYLRAALAAGEVNLDLLRPARRGGAAPGTPGGPPPVAPGGERWSREPIDLAVLQAVDADLELRAAGLVFDRYPFIEPRLSLSLRDGTMTLQELAGRLFDGEVALRGALASRPVPAVELNVRLDGADLEPALRTAFGFSQMSGLVAFNGDFRARGASERGLVRSLNGNAAVSASDGVIRGFDMQRFSDQLGELNRSSDYVDLLAGSFSGGETALTRAAGTWQIEGGVARTEDTKVELEASQGSLSGHIDLANWRMDLRSLLRLTEHPDAPGLGIDVSGPLDAPRRELRTAALEQYLIGRFGQELLRKGLGEGKVKEVDKILELLTRPGESGAEQAEPKDGEPTAPSREEVLDSLLKGLLKR